MCLYFWELNDGDVNIEDNETQVLFEGLEIFVCHLVL